MIQRLNESRQAHDTGNQSAQDPTIGGEPSNPSIPPVRMLEPDESWISLESGNQYAKAEKKDGPSPRWSSNGSWTPGEGMLYV